MKKTLITLVCVLGLLTLTAGGALAVTVDTLAFSSYTNAMLNIDGNGGLGSGTPPTVSFSASPDFSVTASTLGTATGDLGGFTSSNWTITGPILTEGSSEIAGVSGTGVVTITDATGTYTANLALVKIETNTAGSNGSFNDTLVANVTSVSYTGTMADLAFLASRPTNTIDLTWTDITTGNDLTQLTTSGNTFSTAAWSGQIIAATPLPTTALLLGTGLLGLALLGFRRKKTAFQL